MASYDSMRHSTDASYPQNRRRVASRRVEFTFCRDYDVKYPECDVNSTWIRRDATSVSAECDIHVTFWRNDVKFKWVRRDATRRLFWALHKRERERVECVVNDLNIIKVDQNIINDLSRTSERVETNSLLRHSYQQEHVVFSQKISLVEAFFQNMEKHCDWLRISQVN